MNFSDESNNHPTVYLDNAATTKIDPQVLNVMRRYERALYGNASSKYSLGEISKNAIETSREIIASAINAEPSEIYFTSGGTEANNWVIKGLRNKYRFRPMHIISTEFEHHSILHSLQYRAKEVEDIEYTLTQIITNNVNEIRRRNTSNAAVLKVLSKMVKLNKIPYSVYYFSRNLEHVLHDKASDLTDEQKKELSESFDLKYENRLDEFLRFITDSDFAVPGDYKQTWDFIMQGTNSLNRFSNVHLLFSSIKLYEGEISWIEN